MKQITNRLYTAHRRRHLLANNFRHLGSALLLCAAGLVGCTNELPSTDGIDSDGKLEVSFATPSISDIPASALSATRAGLTQNTTVRVVAYKSGSGNPAQANYVSDQAYYINNSGKLEACTVDADGMNPVAASDEALKLLAGTYDFYAITPALPLNSDKTTVNVPHGVDYATSVTANNTISTSALTLNELARKCAQVQLIVKAEDENTVISAISVIGEGLTLTGLSSPPQNVKVGSDLTTNPDVAMLNIPASSFRNSDATHLTSNIILLPVSRANITISYTMSCTMFGTTTQKNITGVLNNVTFEKGNSYTLTASLSQNAEATFKISAWSESSQNVTAGAYPYALGKCVISKDMFGSTTGTMHANWTETPRHYDSDESNCLPARLEIADTESLVTITEVLNNINAGCTSPWRLPTNKEMQTIWALKDKFTGFTTPLFVDKSYWTSTSVSGGGGSRAFFLHYQIGDPLSTESGSYYVRCVQDI